MSRGRVLLFTKGVAVNPASRYRFLQYIPYLQKAGLDVEARPLFNEAYYRLGAEASPPIRLAKKTLLSAMALARRLIDLPEARRADLVVVENQLFPYEQGLLEALLFAFGRRTLFEFDDAIYLTPLHAGKLKRVLKRAGHVIAGNDELAAFARQVSSRVSVVPTVVDMDKYPETPYPPADVRRPFRIGWIGLPITLPYLDLAARPLARLAAERAVELVVISSREPAPPGVPVRFVNWSEENEAEELAALDVGIMPLPDDPWTRGKCGLKLLQYMAAGRAAVASPVGVNPKIVAHGENGFLASTEDQWFQALRKLADDRGLAARLGRAARRAAAEHYSLQVWGPRVAELYVNLIKYGKPTPEA
ncbi:MAG: glycosyltransferase [Myxococcales bacterium]|nr:MAG: glycosyltransferase [Myxococcales bacterium]